MKLMIFFLLAVALLVGLVGCAQSPTAPPMSSRSGFSSYPDPGNPPNGPLPPGWDTLVIHPTGPDHPWGGEQRPSPGPGPVPLYCGQSGSFVVIGSDCGPGGGGGYVCVEFVSGPLAGQTAMLDKAVFTGMFSQCGTITIVDVSRPVMPGAGF